MAFNDFTVVYRFAAAQHPPAAPENRFLSGIVNAIAMGSSLWALVIWGLHTLL